MEHTDMYVTSLRNRSRAPMQSLAAAVALGRKGPLIKEELERPPNVLGLDSVQNAVEELALTLWDTRVSPILRSTAAWALGQIGGLRPAVEILRRLDSLYIPTEPRLLGLVSEGRAQETEETRATLIKGLIQALDPDTFDRLDKKSRNQLYELSQVLVDRVISNQESDPDLITTIAMELSALAVRAPTVIREETLHDLLNARPPISTLAAIGALQASLLPWQWKDNNQRARAFKMLGERRGPPYTPEESQQLIQLAEQFQYAEQEAHMAVDHYSRDLEKVLQRASPDV